MRTFDRKPGPSPQMTPKRPREGCVAEAELAPRTLSSSGIACEFSAIRNSASSAVVTLPRLPGFVHPISESLRRPDVRFRVPTFERLKATSTDKDLKIPEAVIKGRVTELLERMKREKRLKSTESVATICAKIFPSPGKMDEAEFNNAVDVTDRSIIYNSVADADTKVKTVDKPKLQAAMKEASTDVKTSEGDATGLKEVFGTKAAVAKANYTAARKVLDDLSVSAAKVDAEVTTDYNLDDPEVGLGGWASFGAKRMHLLLEVAQVTNKAETKATIIHEASHFANAAVDDQVYYGDPGFFELDEDKKVANAAHYEELPRRISKTSKFDKKAFTPGKSAGGGTVTHEQKVRAATDLYLRKAWDAGVDAHSLVRGVRGEYLAGNSKPFADNKALLLEISKLMDLTLHEQAAGKAVVTTLDVTLSESVSRGVSIVKSLAPGIPFPKPVGVFNDTGLRDLIVADAVVKYGNLFKNPARDKALLDWLEAHYRKLPSV